MTQSALDSGACGLSGSYPVELSRRLGVTLLGVGMLMTSAGTISRNPEDLIAQEVPSGCWFSGDIFFRPEISNFIHLQSAIFRLNTQPQPEEIAEEPREDTPASSAELVRALRDQSGLTWDQISRLFGVSRRAVHLWVSGGRMNAANQELLSELISLISKLPGTSPSEKRASLLQPTEYGYSLFDKIRARHAVGASDINRAPFEFDQLL